MKKQSLVGFSEKMNDYLRITLASPKYVRYCREVLSKIGLHINDKRVHFECFEADLLFVLRFMIDHDITGFSWVRIALPHTEVVKLNESTISGATSNCQIELNVSIEHMQSLGFRDEWSKIPSIRVLSFDIECKGLNGEFPTPDRDPVIQISNVIFDPTTKVVFTKNVFNFGTCEPLSCDAELYRFSAEKDLLEAWSLFVVGTDPDMIIGYNICSFDIPYLFKRAENLGVANFKNISRVRGHRVSVRDSVFTSKAYGRNETKEADIKGRIVLDVFHVIRREYKLRSYSLNAVSLKFLGEQKEDVPHKMIHVLYEGTDKDRKRLAEYCLKDAYLTQKLCEKLCIFINHVEMSRVSGLLTSFILTRGQQIKVLSQIYRKAKNENLIIPTKSTEFVSEENDEVAYQGATVIEPQKGFYDTPIVTLDFASLYPSIMIAHNLCYSTLLTEEQRKTMPEDFFEQSPTGDYFVKASVKNGILPTILKDLLAARSQVKKQLSNEKDPFSRAILDGRQLALKISANSVYGFTGATIGKLPCIEISRSVTGYGRVMIEQIKKIVEDKYRVQNGYPFDSSVIYGDTDSIMINFGKISLEEAMKFGKEASIEVTKHFVSPIKLEFEKVYFPYLLISKKRYAGLFWTKLEKYDKIDMKGIEVSAFFFLVL